MRPWQETKEWQDGRPGYSGGATFRQAGATAGKGHASLAKTDAQRPGRLNEVAVERHGAQTANGVGDFYSNGVGRPQRDHVAVLPVRDKLNGPSPESRAQ